MFMFWLKLTGLVSFMNYLSKSFPNPKWKTSTLLVGTNETAAMPML